MGQGNESLFSVSGSHGQHGCHAIYGKMPLKIFSKTKEPMALGIGMQHWDVSLTKFEGKKTPKKQAFKRTLLFLLFPTFLCSYFFF